MGVKINERIYTDAPFMPGQIFIFGVIALFADSTGHLGQVESFTPGRIIRFGNMKYTTDSHGELVFTSWVSYQAKDQREPLALSPMLNPDQDERKNPSSDPTSDRSPTLPPMAQMSYQAVVEGGEPRPMSDRILEKLPPVPVLDWAQEEHEKLLLNEMLDRIQKLAILDNPISVYDQYLGSGSLKLGFYRGHALLCN